MLVAQSPKRLIVIFTILTAFGATLFCETKRQDRIGVRPPRCYSGLYVKCDVTREDYVWATNEANNTCKPFVNSCLYNAANCRRYRRNVKQLRAISREDCKALCGNRVCPTNKNSTEKKICAFRGGRSCIFDNNCKWEDRFCTSGEYWLKHKNLTPCIYAMLANIPMC